MKIIKNSPTDKKLEPTTPPQGEPLPTSYADPVPPKPSKPKTKATKLALNDRTADFAVICQGTRYMAHKRVLETTSPYFARMFRFNGRETKNKEVEVPDVDALSMKRILDYMYTATYALPSGTPIPQGSYCNHSTFALRHGPTTSAKIFKRLCPCAGKALAPEHLLQHVRIYTVADYFGMQRLKTYAQKGVEDVLHVYWQSENLELADALEEAFTATPDDDSGIRDVLVGALKEHPGLVVDEGEVRAWLDENPTVSNWVNWD